MHLTTGISWYYLLDVLTTLPVFAFYLRRAYSLYRSKWVIAAVAPFMCVMSGIS